MDWKDDKGSDTDLIWGTIPEFVTRDEKYSENWQWGSQYLGQDSNVVSPKYEFHKKVFGNSLIKRGHTNRQAHRRTDMTQVFATGHCEHPKNSQASLRTYQPSSCYAYVITETWRAFRFYRVIVSVESFNDLSFGP